MKRVILVRTRGPRNAGLAARTVVNFGPAELCFAAPAAPDLLSAAGFAEMAHGVALRPGRFPVVATLEEALRECTHSIGFTARIRGHRDMKEWPDMLARVRERALDPAERVALVFGDEQHGLNATEAGMLAELARIPTSREHASLNLALAVGIVLSGLFGPGQQPRRSRKGRPLAWSEREFLRVHLRGVLGRMVQGAAARRDLEASIDRLVASAALESRDARAWHRLLRQLGGLEGPADYGLPEPRGAGRGE
ncbi:MAG: hypothetical protein HY812_15015 [Planctomycetes bacterium]|nr:hypothetical protein [Planctomycetota bacterium]